MMVEIFRNSPHLLVCLSQLDNFDAKSLMRVMGDTRCRLVWNSRLEAPEILVVVDSEPNRRDAEKKVNVQKGYYEPVKPFVLTVYSGVAFVIGVLGVVGGLAYLKWAEENFAGVCALHPATTSRLWLT